MLLHKLLVAHRAATVGGGIAPAINEVAAFALLAAGVTGCFFHRGAVINDPNFVAATGAEHDLVERRIVVERVHVIPKRGRGAAVAGDIHQFGMRSGFAVAGFGLVGVLDEMIPDVPLPNNPAAVRIDRLNFDDSIGHEIFITHLTFIETNSHRLFARFAFDHECKHVTIRHRLYVVVQLVFTRGVVEPPNQIAVPVEFLNAPAFAAAGAALHPEHSSPQQMTVGQQIGGLSRLVFALPLVNITAFVIKQVGDGVVLRRHQRVTGTGVRGVEIQADSLTGIWRGRNFVFRHLAPPATDFAART